MRLRTSGFFVLLAFATGSALAQTPPAAGVAAPAPVSSSPLPPPPTTPAPAASSAQTAPAQGAPAEAAPAAPAANAPTAATPSTEQAASPSPSQPVPSQPSPNQAQTPAAAPAQPAAPAEAPAQPSTPSTPSAPTAQPAPVAPAQPPAPAPAPAVAARSTLFPNPSDPTNVEEGILTAKPTVVLTGTSTWDEGFKTLKAAFRKIEDELKKAGIAPTGRPLTVFVHTDDMGFRFEAMIPIAQVPEGRTELSPEVKFGKTPEGKALRFVHKDSYDEIDGTYETITAYLDAKDIVSKDAFIEEYVSELTDAQDPDLEVNIYVQPKE